MPVPHSLLRAAPRGLGLGLLLATIAAGCVASKPTPKVAAQKATAADAAADADTTAAVSPPVVVQLGADALCRGHETLREAEKSHADWKATEAEIAAQGQDEGNYAHDYRVKSASKCGVAKNNIDDAMKAVLAGPAPKPRGAASSPAWDKKTAPRYLDLAKRRFRLDAGELALLSKNGFMASSRLEADSYGAAFHEIFQSEMPLYVSMDALFHAVYAAHDGLLADLEQRRLKPALEEMLGRMACALPEAAKDYPDEVAHDVDLYLTVARMLTFQADASVFGASTDQAKQLAQLANDGTELRGLGGEGAIELFGRPRVIDFTQYTPRGHYANAPTLDTYFRAAMWLSRLELNLVSRSSRSSHPGAAPDPRETPREVLVALAIADLVEKAGALPLYDLLDEGWALLAGKREDVGVRELLALRKKAGVSSLREPRAADAVRGAIGGDFKRTARLHVMPEGTPDLPAIATLLGPRVVPDAAAARPLVHDSVPGRAMLTPFDVGYFLGHDRAKSYLGADLGRFPGLAPALDAARAVARKPTGTEDLYSAWFSAVLAVAEPQGPGSYPSYTASEAWSDAKLNTAVTAFGHIRHNYVLVAGQPYDVWGCEIPEGWVEPAPRVLEALGAYARRGAKAITRLDPHDMGGAGAYFARLEATVRVLSRIVERELSGQPLTADENRFLGFVAEYLPFDPGCIDSCAPPHYSGWWFDLFPKRKDGLLDPVFVADYYTSSNAGQAAYVGAKKPVYGFFVVDQGGPPRVMIGPVARGFGQPGPISPRLKDADVPKLAVPDAPWLRSFVAPAPKPFPLLVRETQRPSQGRPSFGDPFGDSAPARPAPRSTAWELTLRSTEDLGPVTVTLLDHHRRPLQSQTQRVAAQDVRFRFDLPPKSDAATGMFVRARGVELVWVPPQEKAVGRGLSFGVGGMEKELADPDGDGAAP